MDTEQGSLSMLFKGITFTVTIENKERVYRRKTSEEETWFDWIKEGYAMSGQKGALHYEQYPASKLSLETKKIITKISFPKNFSGSLELKALDEQLSKYFFNYIYLFDSVGNVSKVSLLNNYEEKSDKKNFARVENNRLIYQEKIISIKDGQELLYNIKVNEIENIDEVLLNNSDENYPFFIEENVISLNEKMKNKSIQFYLSFKSNNEVISQNYWMELNLGSDRKN